MRYKKMDMHVHSCFSEEDIPGVSGVRFSPRESPEELYERAKARGMDFVTITDHDTIEGCLDFISRNRTARDFVIGEEVSTRLPVSGLTIHINVYGHSRRQHAELQRRRASAFAVVDFCRDERLYCCWNHPFYRENLSTIEESEFMRLLAEVPAIEARNGGRMQLLNELAEEIAVRAGKPVQAGSDTHTGDIGSVYTAVPCATPEGFLAGILAGDSRIAGSHSTWRGFLFRNYLTGTRQTVRRALRRRTSTVARARVMALGALAVLLSPWVVSRHFREQLDMARIALANLSDFRHPTRTILDVA
jgi:predicted metal-dependent phosphoesterase TrpH